MSKTNSNNQPMLRVLIVAADSDAITEDSVKHEAEICRAAVNRDGGVDAIFHALRIESKDELSAQLREFQPNFLHFTSHGGNAPEVSFVAPNNGRRRALSGAVLGGMLNAENTHLDGVLFNGCKLSSRGGALRSAADVVIEFRPKSTALDVSSLVADAFYSGLESTINFKSAFKAVNTALRRDGNWREVTSYFRDYSEPEASGLPNAAGPAVFSHRSRSDALSSGVPRDANLKSGVADGTDPKDGSRVFRVWYGTNRAPVNEADIPLGFGADRGKKTYYGHCDVSIPKHHKIGSIGGAWLDRFPFFWRDNRLLVRERSSLDEEGLVRNLNESLAPPHADERSVLVFLHGYNVTFDQAAVRAAQLGFDLGVHGATAFFSWPSKGTISGYAADVAAMEASEDALTEFIDLLVNRTSAESVDLIAHSMGNRGLLRSFSASIDRIRKTIEKPLRQIVLAAPDVDADLFKTVAALYAGVGERTTMYVSEKDKALLSSGLVHDYPRAGYTPPLTIVEGVDTVEVTAVDLTFLGHGYVAEMKAVLQDMHALFVGNVSPDKRFGLEALLDSTGVKYWRFRS